MTVVARRVVATPVRSATDAWSTIVNLIAPKSESEARRELLRVNGIASSIIASETTKDAAIVVWGSGPRVRVYCLYDEDAIVGDSANEQALSFCPTEGDWHVSLPCLTEDLSWVQAALKKHSTKITARDMASEPSTESAGDEGAKSATAAVDLEAFFRS